MQTKNVHEITCWMLEVDQLSGLTLVTFPFPSSADLPSRRIKIGQDPSERHEKREEKNSKNDTSLGASPNRVTKHPELNA
jgi:hypothetical protein